MKPVTPSFCTRPRESRGTRPKPASPALPQQSGVPAHLATITSSSENQWIVDELLLTAVGSPLAQSQVWVGGFQELAPENPTKAGVG